MAERASSSSSPPLPSPPSPPSPSHHSHHSLSPRQSCSGRLTAIGLPAAVTAHHSHRLRRGGRRLSRIYIHIHIYISVHRPPITPAHRPIQEPRQSRRTRSCLYRSQSSQRSGCPNQPHPPLLRYRISLPCTRRAPRSRPRSSRISVCGGTAAIQLAIPKMGSLPSMSITPLRGGQVSIWLRYLDDTSQIGQT